MRKDKLRKTDVFFYLTQFLQFLLIDQYFIKFVGSETIQALLLIRVIFIQLELYNHCNGYEFTAFFPILVKSNVKSVLTCGFSPGIFRPIN